MKKPYTQPEMELREAVLSDTLTTSGDNNHSDPFGDFWQETDVNG